MILHRNDGFCKTYQNIPYPNKSQYIPIPGSISCGCLLRLLCNKLRAFLLRACNHSPRWRFYEMTWLGAWLVQQSKNIIQHQPAHGISRIYIYIYRNLRDWTGCITNWLASMAMLVRLFHSWWGKRRRILIVTIPHFSCALAQACSGYNSMCGF